MLNQWSKLVKLKVIAPISPPQGDIYLPLSKSMMNRALAIQALSGGVVRVQNQPDSDDALRMSQALRTGGDTVNCGDAGTVARFVLALACTWNRKVSITGSKSLSKRPMGPLVDALRQLGFDLTYLGELGCLPIRIEGTRKEITSGPIQLEASLSSQFATALMLIAPTLEGGLHLELTGEITSRPYLEMTSELLQQCGINLSWRGNNIQIQPGPYQKTVLTIEPDWSAAGYWYEIVALFSKSRIHLPGLSLKSLQGDAVLAQLFAPLGVSTTEENGGLTLRHSHGLDQPFDVDFTGFPDQAQTLLATLCGLGRKGIFKGLHTLPHKETNRVAAMQQELNKIGVDLIQKDSHWQLIPGSKTSDDLPNFSTYSDHRMAMSLAPLAIRLGAVIIENPEVVNKSYPEYWKDLQSVGFKWIP